jgi:hypothetical protein
MAVEKLLPGKSRKQNRVRMRYKRFSRVVWAFSIPKFWQFWIEREFFNSHASLENLPRKSLLTAWISIEAGFEDDSVPECFEAFDQAMGRSNGVAFIEVVRAELLVCGSALQHVVTGGKDRTGDGDQCALGTAQCSQAPELRLQVSPFAFGSCPGGLAQCSTLFNSQALEPKKRSGQSMRKLIFAINTTLDGCCDHTKQFVDEETLEYFTHLTREVDLQVFGRKTYQLMVPYWPEVLKNQSETKADTEFARAFADH